MRFGLARGRVVVDSLDVTNDATTCSFCDQNVTQVEVTGVATI